MATDELSTSAVPLATDVLTATDVLSAADILTTTDVLTATDILTATDVPTVIDVLTTTDVSTTTDVLTQDVLTAQDVPTEFDQYSAKRNHVVSELVGDNSEKDADELPELMDYMSDSDESESGRDSPLSLSIRRAIEAGSLSQRYEQSTIIRSQPFGLSMSPSAWLELNSPVTVSTWEAEMRSLFNSGALQPLSYEDRAIAQARYTVCPVRVVNARGKVRYTVRTLVRDDDDVDTDDDTCSTTSSCVRRRR